MAAIATTKECDEKYREILVQNGISSEVREITTILPKMDGDHFASRCECVSISFQDKSIPPLELFVKKTVTNDEYAALLREMQMFEKEQEFFNTIFEDMKASVKAKNGYDVQSLVPKCYYADNELIVFENLIKRGYVMIEKQNRHSFEQSSTVLKNIAKLHGTSYVLVNELGEDAFLKKYPFLEEAGMWSQGGAAMNGPFLQGIFDMTIKILKGYPSPGSDEMLEHVLKFESDGFNKLAKYFALGNPSSAKVVCHGDIWGTNMLFKVNEETKEFDDCVIIDFQTVHLGSPALDLMYYMFLAVDSQVRRENWKKLLEIYYETFTTTVEKLDGVMKFSLKDLLNDFRKSVEPGYFFGLFFIFGMDVFNELPAVESIEGNVIEALVGGFAGAIEGSMKEKGKDFSIELVEAYNEFLTLTNGQD